jgi:adenylate cyclase
MPESSGPIAIMFAEMTGSTPLYDAHGNMAAVAVVAQCLETLSKVVRQFRGTVIKTIGDRVMASFPEATHAALASSEMQLAIQRVSEEVSGLTRGMRVKVGAHYGEVVLEDDGDIFGDAVNVAARMASMAKADQILVTQDLVDALPPELSSTLRYYDRVDVRGRSAQLEVYEIIWEVSDMTIAAVSSPSVHRREFSRMMLEISGNKVEMGTGGVDFVSLGRADDNEVQCAGALTSRKHSKIEFKRGRFTVTDQSANGTHVQPDGEATFSLRRDHTTLEGSGLIGLGQHPDQMGELAIRYTVE